MKSTSNSDSTLLDGFATALSIRGKEPATVESYLRDARQFLKYLAENRLTYQLVDPGTLVAYQDFLREFKEERENSIRRSVIGIRIFFRYLYDANLVKVSPFDSLPIPSRNDKIPNPLEESDIDHLINRALTLEPLFKGVRDALMISIIAFEGIKANELIALTWNDVLLDRTYEASNAPSHLLNQEHAQTETLTLPTVATTGPIFSDSSIRICGQRSRVIRLTKRTSDLMIQYRFLFERQILPRLKDNQSPRIFCAFRGRDLNHPLPAMTRHGLKFVLYDLSAACGIDHVNTENLRHFSVSYLLQNGMTTDEIMVRLGLRRVGNIGKHLQRTLNPTQSSRQC